MRLVWRCDAGAARPVDARAARSHRHAAASSDPDAGRGPKRAGAGLYNDSDPTGDRRADSRAATAEPNRGSADPHIIGRADSHGDPGAAYGNSTPLAYAAATHADPETAGYADAAASAGRDPGDAHRNLCGLLERHDRVGRKPRERRCIG